MIRIIIHHLYYIIVFIASIYVCIDTLVYKNNSQVIEIARGQYLTPAGIIDVFCLDLWGFRRRCLRFRRRYRGASDRSGNCSAAIIRSCCSLHMSMSSSHRRGQPQRGNHTHKHLCTHAREPLTGDTHTHRGLFCKFLHSETLTYHLFLNRGV